MNPLRLAVWSGPRNISTALMRSWENRPDTIVIDEPFYAHYLKRVDTDHPGQDEILSHHDSDEDSVIKTLLAPLPAGKTIFYQKHMNKHMLPDMRTDWMDQMTHCFLIREPREMITSFMKIVPNVTLHETGYQEQADLFNLLIEQTGSTPIVIDSRDVLETPRRILSLWCEALGIPFTEAMLNWPPGERESDGIWAKHWYGNVLNSTGFMPYKPKNEEVPRSLYDVLDRCNTLYEQMYSHRIH